MKFTTTLLWALAAAASVEAAFTNPSDGTLQAIGNGKRRNDRLKAGRNPSDSATCIFDKNWTFKKRKDDTRTNPPAPAGGRLQGFIDAVQPDGLVSEEEAWYNIAAISPPKIDGYVPAPGDEGSVYYENGYNPTANYISVIDVNNAAGRDATSSTDATWAMWREVKKDRGGATDYSSLKGVIHYSCANPLSLAVGGDLFKGETGSNLVKTFQDGSEEFDALLGLPNGVLATNLLMNYPDSMGRDRQIDSITAWLDNASGSGEQLIGVSYMFS
ncbi:hypothetical protein FQN54_002793 [Arachnomyces sp. PD_36]|nr:hypothetical protein FQN54_002793 [Arachnomyces sp. PD_36]